ncbi:C-factor-like [Mercenaria mercenaria]|uniref:C-factor-like n=1 Tax=Mercenaria mercenaria TaxID=6596 RepID=UPI001E1D46FE|nr:C-factor-like [Mercenaria mercenaria]XP_045188778.1 C-factor-like [Mercenaria mercenaria]XP_053406835.1 C-factor-like [Mercenaria mercenaria]
MVSTAALIQGASRGLGLQFCKTLLSRQPALSIIATCRTPGQAQELQDLKSEPLLAGRLHILGVDVKNEAQIQEAAEYAEKHFGQLDLLVNCAGILHPSGRGETSLKDLNLQGLQETCTTNAFGPLLMGKHFGKLLTKGGGSVGVKSTDAKQQHAGVLVNISAKVGSTTDNALGGWYSYRMSKCALNMATKNLSIELGRGKNKVICVSLHPGTVDTALSRPYHKNVKNLFSVEQSVSKLLTVIDSLTVEDSGKFFTYDKELLPF